MTHVVFVKRTRKKIARAGGRAGGGKYLSLFLINSLNGIFARNKRDFEHFGDCFFGGVCVCVSANVFVC